MSHWNGLWAGVAIGMMVGVAATAWWHWRTDTPARSVGATEFSTPAAVDGPAQPSATSTEEVSESFPPAAPQQSRVDPDWDAKDSMLRSDLQTMRSQLELYKIQHLDHWPTLADFHSQLTGMTDPAGQPQVRGQEPCFGPYLRHMPKNPFSGDSTVGNGPVGSSDWYYNEATGDFRPNDSADHRAW